MSVFFSFLFLLLFGQVTPPFQIYSCRTIVCSYVLYAKYARFPFTSHMSNDTFLLSEAYFVIWLFFTIHFMYIVLYICFSYIWFLICVLLSFIIYTCLYSNKWPILFFKGCDGLIQYRQTDIKKIYVNKSFILLPCLYPVFVQVLDSNVVFRMSLFTYFQTANAHSYIDI